MRMKMYLTQHIPECGSQSRPVVMTGNIFILCLLFMDNFDLQ